MLTIQLLHPSQQALTVSPDPEGLEEMELAMKRQEDNDGVFFEFTLNLDFNKAARSFIRDVEAQGGIDSEITVNVYQYLENEYRNDLIFTGQIKMSNFKIGEISLTSNIEQSGFDRNFINISERDIDLESTESENGTSIPETPIEDVEFHSKTILKRIDVGPLDEDEFLQAGLIDFSFDACATPGGCDRVRDAFVYGQIDGGDSRARELDINFTYPWGFSDISPADIYVVQEAGLADIDVSINLRHRVTANRVGGDVDVSGCGDSDLGHVEIKAFFLHVDQDNNVKTLTQMGSDWVVPACSDQGGNSFLSEYETKTYSASNVNMELGDKVSVYYTVRVSATYQQSVLASSSTISHEIGVQAVKDDTYIKISQNTVFPATNSKCIMVYEALNKMCQYMTNQEDCFRSEFFGRTDTVVPYAQDGEGSLLVITNGVNIRGTDSIIFSNWVEFFQSLSSLYCLGWGFETLDDETRIIRVEPKDYFYDKDTKILTLGQVSELFRTHDTGRYWGSVEYGYPKMENIKQINGIDEFNERRKQSSPLSKTKGKLDIRCVYRASGFEIESQRRLLNSNEDSRLDDENFLITVVRDGMGFKTETDELFDEVNNVFSPDTLYNLRISPAYNIRNWAKILGSNLIKGYKKSYLFSFGSFNYIMTSKRTGSVLVGENDDLSTEDVLTNNEVLYYPEIYEFEHELTKSQYRLLRANPRGYIEFLDWDFNKCEGFLLDISYKLEENLATFTLLRLYRKSTA